MTSHGAAWALSHDRHSRPDIDRSHVGIETAKHRRDLRWIADIRFHDECRLARFAHASRSLFRAAHV